MASQPTTESVSRAAFLRSLGLSAAALSALYFSGCSKGTTDVTPASPTDGTDSAGVATGNADPGLGKIDFTLDLTKPDNGKLKTIGQFVTVGGVVVANTKAGQYVAVLNECRHDGGPLGYRLSQDDFRCQWHGALFNTNGTVKAPPATRPVTLLTITLNADKNALHISA